MDFPFPNIQPGPAKPPPFVRVITFMRPGQPPILAYVDDGGIWMMDVWNHGPWMISEMPLKWIPVPGYPVE